MNTRYISYTVAILTVGFVIFFSPLRKVVSERAFAQISDHKSTLNTLKSRPSITVEQTKQAQSLTGLWKCNDGGLYFMRQVGNQLWWYGESGDGGVSWSNVFQGYITGNKIIGKWADVPKGTAKNYGEMTLSISSNSLRKISGGQNFSGSVWSR